MQIAPRSTEIKIPTARKRRNATNEARRKTDKGMRHYERKSHSKASWLWVQDLSARCQLRGIRCLRLFGELTRARHLCRFSSLSEVSGARYQVSGAGACLESLTER